MRAIKIIAYAVCFVCSVAIARHTQAQFMPVVYDNSYGRERRFSSVIADFGNGDAVVAGTNAGIAQLSWIDRTGECRFTKRFTPDELSLITKIEAISADRVLITGRRKALPKESRPASGSALIINSEGVVERMIATGSESTELTAGKLLPDGSLILSGSVADASGRRKGMVCKLSPANRTVYTYTATAGEQCDWFDVQGGRDEYVSAAFSSLDGGGSSVVRLSGNGSPHFITTLPDHGFKIEKVVPGNEHDLYIAGESRKTGGAVIKIRREGDVVFRKQIISADSAARLNCLMLCSTGEILVGGNNASGAVFALLRSDGTELSLSADHGVVSGMAINPVNNDCIVSLYNHAAGKGKIIKISRQGRSLYSKTTAASYSSLLIGANGDLLMGSPQSGRLTMLSNLGELLFDRYVVEGAPVRFDEVFLSATGEAVFMSATGRLIKLAHGVYVSDITVNEPINGRASAVFTVTLSGYAFSKEGAPLPATVNYKTRAISASEGVNFDPVSGVISFVPSADGSNRYMNKFTVEAPVNANDFLEGSRTFALDLSDVRNSYLIKRSGVAAVEDQPAIVKMTTVTSGVEGEKDLVFELGIFKRDGKPLTNKTGADIVIDGVYGVGTADRLDFDAGRLPRLTIPSGKHSGGFSVVTLEDARYEAAKTVVVDFNKVHAMSDTDVSFGANMISCAGAIYDQAAAVVIESLGDHTSRTNDVLGGLFRISLVRARDGAPLTNNSGSDIAVTVAVSDSSTAKKGEDFAITNAHNLRIRGDGSSAVNLNGVVLYNEGKSPKSVEVIVQDVKAGTDAGPISVSTTANTARFTIFNE